MTYLLLVLIAIGCIGLLIMALREPPERKTSDPEVKVHGEWLLRMREEVLRMNSEMLLLKATCEKYQPFIENRTESFHKLSGELEVIQIRQRTMEKNIVGLKREVTVTFSQPLPVELKAPKGKGMEALMRKPPPNQ